MVTVAETDAQGLGGSRQGKTSHPMKQIAQAREKVRRKEM
jgi:hypothetical protein